MLDSPGAWLYAVETQLERARAADRDEALHWEIHCFADALRNLLRSVQEFRDAPGVRSALVEFDRSIPDARAIRDILEHWDEYINTEGRRQKDGQLPPDAFTVIYNSRKPSVAFATKTEYTADGETAHITINGLIELDLVAATQAARRLVEATQG